MSAVLSHKKREGSTHSARKILTTRRKFNYSYIKYYEAGNNRRKHFSNFLERYWILRRTFYNRLCRNETSLIRLKPMTNAKQHRINATPCCPWHSIITMAPVEVLVESGGSNTSSVLGVATAWDMVAEHSGAYRVICKIFNSRT